MWMSAKLSAPAAVFNAGGSPNSSVQLIRALADDERAATIDIRSHGEPVIVASHSMVRGGQGGHELGQLEQLGTGGKLGLLRPRASDPTKSVDGRK